MNPPNLCLLQSRRVKENGNNKRAQYIRGGGNLLGEGELTSHQRERPTFDRGVENIVIGKIKRERGANILTGDLHQWKRGYTSKGQIQPGRTICFVEERQRRMSKLNATKQTNIATGWRGFREVG